MSYQQRATIVVLIVAVLVVWSLALWGALRPDARADQELTASSAGIDAGNEGGGNPLAPTSRQEVVPGQAEAWTPGEGEAEAGTPGDGQAEAWTPGEGEAEAGTLADDPAEPWTAADGGVPITVTQAAMPVVSPMATASHSATLTSSSPQTPVHQPPATPATGATATRQSAYVPPPLPGGTPTIPQVGRFLLVNQDEQIMHVYQDGIQVRSIPVSSGRPVANAFTPAWRGDVGRYWGSGPFLNTEMWSDHMWYLFPGPRGSILIHSVPYTWDDNTRVYDQPEALGVEPTSHGCVRISPEDAEWLERWDPVGVPIEITPWSGEIGPPDESLERGG